MMLQHMLGTSPETIILDVFLDEPGTSQAVDSLEELTFLPQDTIIATLEKLYKLNMLRCYSEEVEAIDYCYELHKDSELVQKLIVLDWELSKYMAEEACKE